MVIRQKRNKGQFGPKQGDKYHYYSQKQPPNIGNKMRTEEKNYFFLGVLGFKFEFLGKQSQGGEQAAGTAVVNELFDGIQHFIKIIAVDPPPAGHFFSMLKKANPFWGIDSLPGALKLNAFLKSAPDKFNPFIVT